MRLRLGICIFICQSIARVGSNQEEGERGIGYLFLRRSLLCGGGGLAPFLWRHDILCGVVEEGVGSEDSWWRQGNNKREYRITELKGMRLERLRVFYK